MGGGGGRKPLRYLGIRGFESVLRGGIPSRAEVLLLTAEGPGRYLLGGHWILEGLARGERALVVLSGEAPDGFLTRLGRMGVDVPAALATGVLTVVDWHSCWSKPVEGVSEDHHIVRASKRGEDLLAAVDLALPTLMPAAERRAFVDVLPAALKGLDEAAAGEALAALRAKLSEGGVTSIFTGERSMPGSRMGPLLQGFHAVLDARDEGQDVVGFAVLGVGGVKLTPRYRRVRVREDGAEVEAEPVVRTFSCPICDARVPFDADRCPGCGTPRGEMGAKARPPGVMDYVESLGRQGHVEASRGRVSPPPSETRTGVTNGVRGPAGRVNGVAPGRVNGIAPTGRVNGIAPTGRVNGVAPGRTNGLQSPGRTNGLVNGIRRERGGITNGLTNGSGFTNGLGSPRYRQEIRRSRWKLFLVPLLAAILLMSPFFLQEANVPLPFAVDGSFQEWSGVSGYAQVPPAGVDPAVALTGYKVVADSDFLHLYATVQGTWFSSSDVHALFAFIDADRNNATGYRVQGLGADLRATVQGADGSVTSVTFAEFRPGAQDPYNWSDWQSSGSGTAAVAGRELEAEFPWQAGAQDPLILLMADDGRGDRSWSGAAFGLKLGALQASVGRPGSGNVVSKGTPQVLTVDLEAFGAPVTVTGLTFAINDGIGVIAPPLPVTVQPGTAEKVNVHANTGSAAKGVLLVARLTAVATDGGVPVTFLNDTVRAYVEEEPAAKRVDGLFGDWTGPFDTDADPGGAGSVPADRDLQRTAADRAGDLLSLYADVRGEILAGTPAPGARSKPVPGGGSQASPPVPQGRVVGEDVLRVYVDADANASAGAPVLGLRGADYMLEVRGLYGAITGVRLYAWQGRWQGSAIPAHAANDARRLEANFTATDLGAVQIVFQTSGWQGPGDSTSAAGTRGVRPVGDGAYVSDGQFTTTFEPDGRVAVAAGGVSLAWTLPSPPEGTWSLVPTQDGVRYAAAAMEIRYTMSPTRLTEEVVFLSPPTDAALVYGFEPSAGALVWSAANESIAILDGSRSVFELPLPFAIDALGRRTPLQFALDLKAGVLRVPLPGDLVNRSAYPLVVDPVVSYTLDDDSPFGMASEWFGYSVAVGDFNGDGYADVLGGAPNNKHNNPTMTGFGHGAAYIFYGPFTGNANTPNVWINSTNTTSVRFGYSVAAGKFNNDNYWDALVARRSFLPGGAAGPVSIYYGSGSWSGQESTPDVDFVPPNNPKNFGEYVAAGNLDNANYDDVLISEPGRDLNADSSADGVVYVYMSPFSSTVTTANYRLIPSTNGGGQLGLYGIGIGKVDSDAYPDVVVGEPKYSLGGGDGRLQFYKGSHFTSGSGDVSPDATIGSPSGGGNTGNFGFSVSVGKLNGDNYADVLVGAPFKYSNDGRAYIFLANSDGSGLSAGASPSYTLSSQSSGENFGYAVHIADWDGDGTGDAIVGAWLAASGGTNRGAVYWFRDPVTTDTTVDQTLSGSQNSEFFGRTLGAGKFGSDTYMVLAAGGYLWDDSAPVEADAGRVVVAMVPEPAPVLAAAAAVVTLCFVRRGTRRRSRRVQRSAWAPPLPY